MKSINEIFSVIRMGHPTLAKPAEVVVDPTASEIRQIVDNMIATVESLGNAAGLAAPQVDIPLRILIFCIPQDRSDDGIGVPITPLINPVIEKKSDETELGWEGCFSLPGVMGEVPRHTSIKYRYQTLSGDTITQEASGIHARVIQHEVDHLDGILYVQRMPDMSRFGYIDEVKQYILKQPPQ